MTAPRTWRTRGLVAAALIAITGVWAAFAFVQSADTIVWACDGTSCATDDLRSLTLPLAMVATIGAAVTAANTCRGRLGTAVAGLPFIATGVAVILTTAAVYVEGPRAAPPLLGVAAVAVGGVCLLVALVRQCAAWIRAHRRRA